MRSLMVAGCLVLLSMEGCASMRGTSKGAKPAGAEAAPSATGSSQTAVPPNQPTTPLDNKGPNSTVGAENPGETRLMNPSTGSPATKPASPNPNGPRKQGGAAATLPKPAAATTPDKGTAKPTLNLADLEQRLRDTHAIGVFTKLSLKNQVDDLLSAFRALYSGPNKHPPPELRQRYDLLLLKVLSLLQNSDPQLAAAISSSREAIWGILSDPDKFAKI